MSGTPFSGTQARRIAVALQAHGEDVAASVNARMSRLANEAERELRRGAPKDMSTMTNAIRASFVSMGHYRIDVGVDYAAAVDEGRAPGKGLPFVDSPGAQGVLGWLKRRQEGYLRGFVGPLRRGQRSRMAVKARKGSALEAERQADLRGRYFALSRSVKRKGIRANPFFTRVVQRLEREMPQLLAETVQAAVARANAAGAAGAPRIGGAGGVA